MLTMWKSTIASTRSATAFPPTLEGIKEKKPTKKDQFPALGEILVW
jgi:hypothetical protein